MTDRDDECELGYWIGKPFRGPGIDSEASQELLRPACEELGMRPVWCGCYDGNLRRRRVQENPRFVYRHTSEGPEVKAINGTRTGHVMLLTHGKQCETVKSDR
ncbi:MAG: GNAT family N-acetyltransferase [Lachnospiraceae bacterium]